jgi:hypothetical protein
MDGFEIDIRPNGVHSCHDGFEVDFRTDVKRWSMLCTTMGSKFSFELMLKDGFELAVRFDGFENDLRTDDLDGYETSVLGSCSCASHDGVSGIWVRKLVSKRFCLLT